MCAFLKFGPKEGAVRSRSQAVTPIVEKGLTSTRAATKASSVEALLLFIELDVPGPVVEEILPALSNKQPKVVAASLAALTQIFHNYGCKTADPKPVLKLLPKVFGHADKNVRAEATNLTVEFYRWLREAMKPMFWNDLKPTQQTDLEAQFEKVKAEPAPKQERLLRSQQAAKASAPAAAAGDAAEEGEEGEEPAEIDAFDLAEPQEVQSKIPGDFYDNLASAKWKERKEALEALFPLLNVPRIKDGDFHELNRAFAKCMKDANIMVVMTAAQCIEVLAKGLRKGYGKYRATVMQPILERLKEKKQNVADALGNALDAVFLSTSLTDCMEDISAHLVHKNPQVKEGTMKFLIRCLKTTREVPSKQEIATIVESGKKLLSDSSEVLRSGGAEVLGTVMKIIGERAMNPHMEGLDDIRKTKIKEFCETAEVKAKDKPKPPPAARAPPGGPAGPKKVVGKKPALGTKKPAPAAAAPPPVESAPLAPQPTSRAAPGARLGVPKPSGIGGLKPPPKRALPGPSGIASPRKPPAAAPTYDDEDEFPASPPPHPKPRMGLGRGGPTGLAGRTLTAKPSAPAPAAHPQSPTPSSGLTALERAELEELRAAKELLRKQVEDARHDRSKLLSEIQELKNQNAGLIEDHTRDVLSIKAKETQLVRARSDAEAAEQTNERLRRELERLKRALNKAESQLLHTNGAGGPASPASPGHHGMASPTHDDAGIYRDEQRGGFSGAAAGAAGRHRMSFTSTLSEEKENGDSSASYPRSKLSPELRYAGSAASSGRGSPARGFRRDLAGSSEDHLGGRATATDPAAPPPYSYGGAAAPDRAGSRAGSRMDGGGGAASASGSNSAGSGVESWKRAAEVTSQLKARIEQMKVSVAFATLPSHT